MRTTLRASALEQNGQYGAFPLPKVGTVSTYTSGDDDEMGSADQQTQFCPLSTGTEALAARIRLIDEARESIDARYYTWSLDETGSLLMNRLRVAARRGVRVRLLIDSTATAGDNHAVLNSDGHENIELRIFNPAESQRPNLLLRWLSSADRLAEFRRQEPRLWLC